jgi:hypothetical protein
MEIPAGYLERIRAAFPALSLSTVHLNSEGLMSQEPIPCKGMGLRNG